MKNIKIVPLTIAVLFVILIAVGFIQWASLSQSQTTPSQPENIQQAEPAILPELPQNSLYLKNAPVYLPEAVAVDETPVKNTDEPKPEINSKPSL